MRALPRASDFALAAHGMVLLERSLDLGAIAVRQSCSGWVSGSVCALAFVYVEEGYYPPAITHLGALTVSGRAGLLSARDGRGLERLWSPADWDHWDSFSGNPDELDRDLERLGGLLAEAGCEDPEGAFLCELAWRLSRADWSGAMQASADFACWAMEHEDGGSAHETFRLTAPGQVVESYEARGWLPPSSESRERAAAETIRGMGATAGQARELLTIMEDLHDPEDIVEWLNDPAEMPGPDPDDIVAGPSMTPREALSRGRADLVIDLARSECGDE